MTSADNAQGVSLIMPNIFSNIISCFMELAFVFLMGSCPAVEGEDSG